MVNVTLQFEAVSVIYLYKIPITWISSYFCLQRFSSISLNQLYVLPNVCETCVITDYWPKNPQFVTLQLTHGVHGDNEGHKCSRPINLSEQLYIANAQCDFSFITVFNCVTFQQICMHIGDWIRYFFNRKISAIQTKHNSWLRHETRSFCEGSVMHGPREEVGGGGGRWPGLTLKITSSIGNKQ